MCSAVKQRQSLPCAKSQYCYSSLHLPVVSLVTAFLHYLTVVLKCRCSIHYVLVDAPLVPSSCRLRAMKFSSMFCGCNCTPWWQNSVFIRLALPGTIKTRQLQMRQHPSSVNCNNILKHEVA